MTWSLVIEARALGQASRWLAEDPEGLRDVLRAIDALLADPRPPTSFPYGSQDVRRLRVGGYRVLYEIREDTVVVENIGRSNV